MKVLNWSLPKLCAMVRARLDNQFDCIIHIDGLRGLGKSTFAYKLCSQVKGADYFNPYKDIMYSQKEVMEELSKRTHDVLFVDEAIIVGYNRDFFSESQKDLIKMLNMYRDSCNLFISCIPNFYNLDKHLQKLCCIRITIIRRGLALIHLPKPAMFNNDIWDTDNNRKEEMKWNKYGDKPKYTRLSTFAGLLKFTDLTPIQREVYNKVKHEKRNHVMGFDIKIEDNVDRIVDKILKGEMNSDKLKLLGDVSGIKWDKFRKSIREKLKEKGEVRQLREILSSNSQIDIT